MTQTSPSSDTDWATVGWVAGGAFVFGLLIGVFVGGPILQKMKDKKGKTTTPAK